MVTILNETRLWIYAIPTLILTVSCGQTPETPGSTASVHNIVAKDGGGQSLGTVLTGNAASVTLLSSTGHIYLMYLGGTFNDWGVNKAYSGSSCTGTIKYQCSNFSASSKLVLYSSGFDKFYLADGDSNGLIKTESFSQVSWHNGSTCTNASATSTVCSSITEVSRTEVGIPTTIALPITFHRE